VVSNLEYAGKIIGVVLVANTIGVLVYATRSRAGVPVAA
jgi:hypothetical protein